MISSTSSNRHLQQDLKNGFIDYNQQQQKQQQNLVQPAGGQNKKQQPNELQFAKQHTFNNQSKDLQEISDGSPIRNKNVQILATRKQKKQTAPLQQQNYDRNFINSIEYDGMGAAIDYQNNNANDISLAQLINNTSLSQSHLMLDEDLGANDHLQHNTFNPNQRVNLNSYNISASPGIKQFPQQQQQQQFTNQFNGSMGISGMTMGGPNFTQNSIINGNVMMRQDELLSMSMASQNNTLSQNNHQFQDTYQRAGESGGSSQIHSKNVTSNDVYDQLKGIRAELQKVKLAKNEMQQFMDSQDHDNNFLLDDNDESRDHLNFINGLNESLDSNYQHKPSQIEQKYQFLMRGQVFKTLDAPIVNQQDINPLVSKMGNNNFVTQINYLELNNKLIEEAYHLSKRREYVQLHMEESDLAILDLDKKKALAGLNNDQNAQNISHSFSHQNSNNNLRGNIQSRKPSQLHTNPLNDISNQGEDRQEDMVTSIDINLLTNNDRLTVSIPNYDNHYRLYFENPDGFAQNQEIRLNQKKIYTKINEEKNVEFEKRLFQQFKRMNECEQVDLIGKVIPQFADCMRDLQQFRLKYCVLLDRVRKFAPLPFRQTLTQDKIIDQLGILMDLKSNDQPGLSSAQNQNIQNVAAPLKQMSTLNKKQKSNQQNDQNQPIQTQKTQKSSNQTPTPTATTNFKDDDSIREIQRIKEQLGGAEQKLKDAQLQRLQEKVKGFAQTEKHLRIQISEIEQRDESLINKIENAICFGKVMVTSKPLIIRSLAGIQSSVQYNAIDKPFQAGYQSTINGGSSNLGGVNGIDGVPSSNQGMKEQKDMSLLERLDQSIGLLLEQEFNELYNELKGYKLNLQSRFCLLTEEHIIFYNDIHMLNEHARFYLSSLDFVDLGIVLQNNQVNKRVFFMKMVHQNVEEKQREVFLISLYEDQIYKWDNTLEPSDDIKFQDRSFKLIKSRLLKAGMSNIRASNDYEDDDKSHLSNDESENTNYYGQTRGDFPNQGSAFKGGVNRNNRFRKATMLSDDGNQTAIQRMLNGGNATQQYDETGTVLQSSPGYNSDMMHIERQFQDNLVKQSRRLEEVGLTVDPPTPNDKIMMHLQDISGTEDIQRAMEEMNNNVQQKIKLKMQLQDQQERDKSIEQQKRTLERQQMTQEYIKAFKELSLGTTFLKYGAMGQPKNRHVFLFENGKRLCWKDPGGNKSKSYILIKDITKITLGRETKKFKRFKGSTDLQIQLSLSIHTSKRSLDLEAANLEEMHQFLTNLQTVMTLINDPKIALIKGLQKKIQI
eukprot:403372690